jgi:3',5'-cyclic AMP phosphodiesterase CpdA
LTLLSLLLCAQAFALESPWRSAEQIKRLPKEGKSAFCFWVMGDSRQERRAVLKGAYPANDVFSKLLDNEAAHGCDLTVHLGDIVLTGTEEEYAGLSGFLDGKKLAAPFFVAAGNHEVVDKNGLANFKAAFGDDYFSFDHKGFRFIVLDSARRKLGEEQRAWLKEALKTPLRKLVFTHMPPMPLQSWHDSAFQRAMGRRTNTILRDDGTLTDLMRDEKVERFYSAHIHGFGQADFKGVRYVLSGCAGSPMYPWYFAKYQFYHAVLVKIDEKGKLTEQACGDDGKCRPLSSFPVFPEAYFLEK